MRRLPDGRGGGASSSRRTRNNRRDDAGALDCSLAAAQRSDCGCGMGGRSGDIGNFLRRVRPWIFRAQMGDGGDGRLLGISAGDLSAFLARSWQAGRGALYPIAPRMEDASAVALLILFRVSGGADCRAVATVFAG